jgi:hypothetical protein
MDTQNWCEQILLNERKLKRSLLFRSFIIPDEKGSSRLKLWRQKKCDQIRFDEIPQFGNIVFLKLSKLRVNFGTLFVKSSTV